ncbi:MAG: hypothetical protein ACE364_08390 [Chlorobiota bacterium]
MLKKFLKISIIFFLLLVTLFLIFDIGGTPVYQMTVEDSKDLNTLLHVFRIEGSKVFIIEKDTFEIEGCWVSQLVYRTNFRFKKNVNRDSYILNLRFTNNKIFEQKYTEFWGESKSADYLFKLHFNNYKVEYKINGIRSSGDDNVFMLSLEQDTFEDLLADEDKYLCLYKDTIPVKKFKLVN